MSERELEIFKSKIVRSLSPWLLGLILGAAAPGGIAVWTAARYLGRIDDQLSRINSDQWTAVDQRAWISSAVMANRANPVEFPDADDIRRKTRR